MKGGLLVLILGFDISIGPSPPGNFSVDVLDYNCYTVSLIAPGQSLLM